MRTLSKAIAARLPAIAIHRKTTAVNWPYGATDKPAHAPGDLFYPDGLDPALFRDG